MTAPVGVVSIYDGSRTTVADLIGSPMFVPTKLQELLANQFISTALFRNAGGNPSGVVAYTFGNPLFLEEDIQDVAEFAEIPVGHGDRGLPQVAFATKRGLAIRISKEMIDENRIGAVNDQMRQLRNTFIRANDRSFRALLQSSVVPSTTVSTLWTNTTSNPRVDIANAINTIASAQPTNWPAGVGSTDTYWGYEPDTIVLHPGTLPVLISNDNFLKVYVMNPLNQQSPAYTGSIPAQIMGLDVVLSRSFPINQALVLQRGVVGFYSDTRPMQFTALYPEGNGPNGGPTESYRSDATIKRAMAVDQPAAAMWLKGIS